MARTRVASTDNAASALLVEAIECALAIETFEQFDAWLSEPLAALMQHEAALRVAIEKNGATTLHCVVHTAAKLQLAPEALHLLCDPEQSPGPRWAQTCRTASPIAFDAQRLQALWPEAPAALGCIHSVIVLRLRLPAGDECALLLFNVPAQWLDRGLYLLTLLAPHLQAAHQRIADRRQRCLCAELTPREQEILRLMAVSHSNREISAKLAINPITLKHHVTKIYRKLDVHNRIDAVARLQQADCTSACRPANR